MQRYDTSADNFRRILHRKLVRRGIPEDVEQDELSGWVDDVISKYAALGAIDDFEYAVRKARDLHARGKARSRIKAWLRQKGVPADIAVSALQRVADATPDMDLHAAMAVARRRRIGPFRRPSSGEPDAADSEMRRHELAILARSGFSFSVARMVVDADSEETLSASLYGVETL